VLFADSRSKQQVLADQLHAQQQGGHGLTLIFAGTRRLCEALHFHLQEEGLAVGVIHGERTKSKERDAIINGFIAGRTPVLVTTDGSLRKVDLPHIPSVISYDMAPSMEAYLTRLEFTGRSGHTGSATTIVTEASSVEDARWLVDVLREARAEVPRWLEALVSLRPVGVVFS